MEEEAAAAYENGDEADLMDDESARFAYERAIAEQMEEAAYEEQESAVDRWRRLG